jgi:hypothetical protein
MNCVILSCAKTGRAFNSGLHADPDDLRFVPLSGKYGHGAGSAVAFMNLSSPEHVFVNARTTAVGTGSCAGPSLLGSQGDPRRLWKPREIRSDRPQSFDKVTV